LTLLWKTILYLLIVIIILGGFSIKQAHHLLIVSLLIFLLSSPMVPSFKDQAQIIYVDDDNIFGPWDGSIEHPFVSIQDGLDHAIGGDWIFVHSGIYYENIIIEESIHLLGEDKRSTIIDGQEKDDVITIISDHVIVSGFTVQKSSHQLQQGIWWKAGIRLLGSHVVIIDNIIQDNLQGIFVKQVENLTLIDNQFFHDGLTIYPYDTDYKTRPALERSHFIHRIDNNTVNGKPLIYLVDQKNIEIPTDAGQVILVNCTNVSLRNATIIHVDFPLIYVFCQNCVIENSYISDNDGICVFLDSDDKCIEP